MERHALGLVACLVLLMLAFGCSKQRPADSSVIRWGSDESGGAPYEFRDPKDPGKRIGFEVEIADEISKRIKKKVEFVQSQWDTLIPALNRNDFDMAMSGIEITEDRKTQCDFTRPYYVYTEQLVTRADTPQINSLADCKGKKVGTLAACAAERVLKKADGIEVKSYDDNVRPYDDLAIGRLDAVLLDLPIAIHFAKPNPKLRFAGEPFAEGFYGIAVRKTSPDLLKQLNDALDGMIKDGTLKTILSHWGLWNPSQAGLSK